MNAATQILAIWGALLSTILAVIESMRFYYEGVRIKVEVRGNYVFFPKSEPYGDKSYILIIVSNKGKRQTTITHAWLRTATNKNLLATDCFFKGPQKLQEGDYTQFIMKEDDAPKHGLMSRDYTAVISDATGRKFYSHILPVRWFKITRMKFFVMVKEQKEINSITEKVHPNHNKIKKMLITFLPILGGFLIVLATLLGIANNFEQFHKIYDNCWFWKNFNEGVQRIMHNGKNIQTDNFENPNRVITVNGMIDPNNITVKVIRLMDTDPGFEEIKYHIVKNLIIKPDYKINAIVNEQVYSRGDVNNPYLSLRIISLIPTPTDAEKYKNINLKAYCDRREVTTEFFLNEWLKEHRKIVVWYFCGIIFLIGLILQKTSRWLLL